MRATLLSSLLSAIFLFGQAGAGHAGVLSAGGLFSFLRPTVAYHWTPGMPLSQLKRDARRLVSRPPKTLYRETPLACVAVAVYHEARNQSILGQKAVASVILQRTLVPGRWGDTPCEVVRPVQFSFMTSRYRFPPIDDIKAWTTAVRVALTVMYEGPLPELKGADHYHTRDVTPDWSRRMPVVARIGDHVFHVDPETRTWLAAARRR